MRHEHKRSASPVLPPDLERALAAASAAVALTPARQAAVGERLMARVKDEPQRFITVRRDDGQWEQLAPDIAMKILQSSDSMQAFLLRLDPGACLPSHPHPADEMCFVLEGEVTLGDVTVGPGDYHVALAGTTHGEITTRTGCLLLIRTDDADAHRRALGHE